MNIFPTVAVPFYVPTHVPSSTRTNGFPLPPTVSSAHCGLSQHTLLTCPVCSRLRLEPSCLSACLTSSPAQTFPAKPSSPRRMPLMGFAITALTALSGRCKSLRRVRLFVTPRATRSVGFSRPELWSGWPFPPPGDLPNPGIEPRSPALQADSLPAEPQGKPKNTGVG